MKKYRWICLLTAALIALSLASGCSIPPDDEEKGSSPSPVVVNDTLSVPPISSSSISSLEPSDSSQEASSDASSAAQPSENEFKTAFDDNPIDAAFNNESAGDATTMETQALLNRFTEIWETEISVADKKAKQKLKGDALTEYRNGLIKWENNREAALEAMKKDVREEYGGSAAALEISQRTLEFYRSRVYDIYYAIFRQTGELPELKYETAVG